MLHELTLENVPSNIDDDIQSKRCDELSDQLDTQELRHLTNCVHKFLQNENQQLSTLEKSQKLALEILTLRKDYRTVK